MSGVSSAIREDLGVLAERLIPFVPGEVIREKLWELHEEYKEKVANLDDLNSNRCRRSTSEPSKVSASA